MKTKHLLLFILSCFFIHPIAHCEVLYELIDLGTIPGYDASLPWSINNQGQVVGFATDNSTWQNKAVLFDTSGNFNNINLGTYQGQNAEACGINDNGQIVGYSGSELENGPFVTLFDSTGNGQNTNIYNPGAALSINNNGIAAGYAVDESGGLETAALFDTSQPGTFSVLGKLVGHDSSIAYSINENGQVVGGSCEDNGLYNNYYMKLRATLFDTSGSGNHLDLGALGGLYSIAICINNHGQIVGRADIENDGPWHAAIFNYNGDGDNLDLGTIDGFINSVAMYINDKGQIVGQANNLYDNGTACAVLFDPTGGGNNIKLNDLIDPALGWYLYSATCINENGWICGNGKRPGSNSAQQAYLLKPVPEPSTIILLVLGALRLLSLEKAIKDLSL